MRLWQLVPKCSGQHLTLEQRLLVLFALLSMAELNSQCCVLLGSCSQLLSSCYLQKFPQSTYNGPRAGRTQEILKDIVSPSTDQRIPNENCSFASDSLEYVQSSTY